MKTSRISRVGTIDGNGIVGTRHALQRYIGHSPSKRERLKYTVDKIASTDAGRGTGCLNITADALRYYNETVSQYCPRAVH